MILLALTARKLQSRQLLRGTISGMAGGAGRGTRGAFRAFPRAQNFSYEFGNWRNAAAATVKSFAPFGPRFPPAPLSVAICVAQWSALLLTALHVPCARFCPSRGPDNETAARDMNESLPAPSGCKCGSPPDCTQPIPGPEATAAHPLSLAHSWLALISINGVKCSRAWPAFRKR